MCVAVTGDVSYDGQELGAGNNGNVVDNGGIATGPDGRWEIWGIPPGNWLLGHRDCGDFDSRYVGAWYPNQSQREDAARFIFSQGDTYVVTGHGIPKVSSLEIDIYAQPRTGLTGTVRLADGSPLAGICVKYFLSESPYHNSDLERQTGGSAVRTDDAGGYVLPGPVDQTREGSSIKVGFYPCDDQFRSDLSSPWRGQFWYRAASFAAGRTVVFKQGQWLLGIDADLEAR